MAVSLREVIFFVLVICFVAVIGPSIAQTTGDQEIDYSGTFPAINGTNDTSLILWPSPDTTLRSLQITYEYDPSFCHPVSGVEGMKNTPLCCATCRWLRLTNTAVNPSASGNAFWKSQSFSLSNGFESVFQYFVSIQRTNNNDLVPTGFGMLLIDSLATSGNYPQSGDRLGLMPDSLGVATTWNNDNFATPPKISLVQRVGQTAFNNPVPGTTAQTSWFPANSRLVLLKYRVVYDTRVSPPLLQVYGGFTSGDSGLTPHLNFTERVNLNSLINNDRVFAGFGGGSAVNRPSAQYLVSWQLRPFQPKNAYIWCPNGYQLYINGALVGDRASSSPWYSADSYSASITANRTVAFRGLTGASSAGCLAEIHLNNINIDMSNRWKCKTFGPTETVPANWMSPTFVDDDWTAASVLGTNPIDNSKPYRLVPNLGPNTQRVWGSNTNTEVYCRATVPRYCGIAGTPDTCFENELCGTDNLCYCPPPLYGALCDALNLPELTSISPSQGSILGGTRVTLSGDYFSKEDTCLFDSQSVPLVRMNYTSAYCVSPSRQTGSVAQIAVQRASKSYSTPTLAFTYTPVITLTTRNPTTSKVREQALVTITGTNFVAPMTCRFGEVGSEVVANVLDDNTLTCRAPIHPPGNVAISVSRNNVDYYGNLTFRFHDFVSKYCRDYRDEKPGLEFDFVSETQTSEGGDKYFSANVALRQTVTVTPSGLIPAGGGFSDQPAAVVDEDFCCAIEGNNAGKFCGLQFPKKAVSTPVEVVVALRSPGAYINELITSWHDPCSNMPLSYVLSSSNDNGGNWVTIKTRSTAGDSSCFIAPGDNLDTSFCVDYFTPRTATHFKITFDLMNVPARGSYAWLYEISIQGKYLDVPDSISFAVPTLTVASTPNTTFSPLPLSFRGILNNLLGSVPTAIPITMELKRRTVVGSTVSYDPAPGLLQGGPLTQDYSDATASSIFSDVYLVAPQQGNYGLAFSSPGLAAKILDVVINPGSPVQLTLAGGNARRQVQADEVTTLALSLCVTDVGGNLVAPGSAVPITVVTYPSDIVMTGDISKSLNAGATCTSFDLVLEKPRAIDFTLRFLSSTLGNLDIPVSVLEGIPSSIGFANIPVNYTNNGILPAPIELSVFDGAGNRVGGFGSKIIVQATISPAPLPANSTLTPTGAARKLSGVKVDVLNGAATFDALAFDGQRSRSYVITFSANLPDASLPNPPTVNLTVFVAPCQGSPLPPGSNPFTGLSEDGYECQCLPGYEPKVATGLCGECDEGQFKSLLGNDPCRPCEVQKTTDGPGQTSCVCETGFYELQGTCFECPEGGICRAGKVVGTQAGYWRPETDDENATLADPSSLNFYRCYRGAGSEREKKAAAEACPGSETSIAPECGEGYTGNMCLECVDGYGHSGPFCDECPAPALNWFIIVLCSALLLGILVFLVVQGQTPKNKESVSGRILVNHIQMLALLSAVGAAWTDPFQSMILVTGVTTFVDSNYVATDCALKLTYYQELAFFLVVPILTFIIVALVMVAIYWWNALVVPCFTSDDDSNPVSRSKVRRDLISKYILSVTVVLFVIYPAICLKVLELFDCTIIIEGSYYLNASPDIICGNTTYGLWLIFALVILFGYCLGLPIAAFVLLWKFRNSENEYIQMVLRFFYDGFKPNRYYWEIIVIVRKFAITIAIIFGRQGGALYQIYGFVWVVQAALLVHIIFRPYISGRQFRLELWSLLSILITLGATLYIPTLKDETALAVAFSIFATVVNIFVFVAFFFFIGRGLTRKFAPVLWRRISSRWEKFGPRMLKNNPRLEKTIEFFQMFAKSSEYDRDLLYANIEKWWDHAPNYKRRRFMAVLLSMSKATPFQNFLGRGQTSMRESVYLSRKSSEINMLSSSSANNLIIS